MKGSEGSISRHSWSNMYVYIYIAIIYNICIDMCVCA